MSDLLQKYLLQSIVHLRRPPNIHLIELEDQIHEKVLACVLVYQSKHENKSKNTELQNYEYFNFLLMEFQKENHYLFQFLFVLHIKSTNRHHSWKIIPFIVAIH